VKQQDKRMRVHGKNLFGFLIVGLLLQGCASAELAIDLFKKPKLLQNRITKLASPIKNLAFGIIQNAI
jgi:hypothetical protein